MGFLFLFEIEISTKLYFFTVPRLNSLFLIWLTRDHNVEQCRFSILTVTFDFRYLHLFLFIYLFIYLNLYLPLV